MSQVRVSVHPHLRARPVVRTWRATTHWPEGHGTVEVGLSRP